MGGGVELSPALWVPTVPKQGRSQRVPELASSPPSAITGWGVSNKAKMGARTWGDSNTLYQYHGAERRDFCTQHPELPSSYALTLASQVTDPQGALCLVLLPQALCLWAATLLYFPRVKKRGHPHPHAGLGSHQCPDQGSWGPSGTKQVFLGCRRVTHSGGTDPSGVQEKTAPHPGRNRWLARGLRDHPGPLRREREPCHLSSPRVLSGSAASWWCGRGHRQARLLARTMGMRMLSLGKAAAPAWGSHSSPQNPKRGWGKSQGVVRTAMNTPNSAAVPPGSGASPGGRCDKRFLTRTLH